MGRLPSRWWVGLLPALWLGLMLLGGAQPDEAHAQTAATPSHTATPFFPWLVPDANGGTCERTPTSTTPTATPGGPTATPTTTATPGPATATATATPANSRCLHVDPVARKFVYYPDRLTPGVSPIAATVRHMTVNRQRVVWSWTDLPRRTFVWANIDRVRKVVKMTLWERGEAGVSRQTLSNQGTPWPMPMAEEPAMLLQDLRFQPRQLVIKKTDQVHFQNNLRGSSCGLFVYPEPGGTEPTTGRAYADSFLGVVHASLQDGDLLPGRIAPPFPVRPPGAPKQEGIAFWRAGTFQVTCANNQRVRAGVIIVRDG